VNRQGGFNVPYGSSPERRVVDEDNLRRVAERFKGVSLRTTDFVTTVRSAGEGDFVYLDPPYTVAHSNNGFRRYNERLFRWEDQRRLASLARRLADRGCHVAVSNADHHPVAKLYPDFFSYRISRRSGLAANPSKRIPTTEVLISTFPTDFLVAHYGKSEDDR
jgi:DNA adenine methylase